MNLTFFINSVYGGGAERVTCNLANYMVCHGHEVDILTISETEKSYELDSRVKKHTLFPLNNKRKGGGHNTLVRVLRLWKYLLRSKKDAYIVMLPEPIILLLFFRWMTKAKIIASERVDPATYSNLTARLLKWSAKKADGFVFQTDGAKEWYGDSVKNTKTSIIPNAINPAFFRPRYQGEKKKLIAGVGQFRPQKNFSLLINAFSRISHEIPDYNLVIYGEGRLRNETEKLVRELNLVDRVFLPGNIQNIADTLEKNTLFVLSSNYEGMPNALMEAMALGLPCISTDCPCGGPRFLIKNGINGYLVPVGDVEAMANTIKTVLLNPIEAKRIGEMGSTIKERLNPDTIYSTWEKFINDVIQGN